MKGAVIGLVVVSGVRIAGITKSDFSIYNRSKVPAQPLWLSTNPHQYIETMASYLRTLPHDGVFGESRIPTLHGEKSGALPGYSEIQNLEGKVSMRSAVVGLYPEETTSSRRSYAKEHQEPFNEDLERIRVSNVHLVDGNQDSSDEAYKEYETETNALKEFAVELRKKALDSKRKVVNVNGRLTSLVAKAVHAAPNLATSATKTSRRAKPSAMS